MKTNTSLILHIPHSSTTIPAAYRSMYLHPEQLDELILSLTDLYTDELFACDEADTLIFPVSRFLCDVERFRDKAQEEMTQRGMWICYTKTPFGDDLARFDQSHEQHIVNTYYDAHHRRFSHTVGAALARHDQAIIIDCHSFPDQLPYYPAGKCPDICIGTDSYHTPAPLLEYCRSYFLNLGYTAAVNHPFSGAIVPMEWYRKDKRVQSLMIEVNRNLYCQKDGRKSSDFSTVRHDLHTLLASLSLMFPHRRMA
jgi:N-formylglutamate deformylase